MHGIVILVWSDQPQVSPPTVRCKKVLSPGLTTFKQKQASNQLKPLINRGLNFLETANVDAIVEALTVDPHARGIYMATDWNTIAKGWKISGQSVFARFIGSSGYPGRKSDV